MKQKISVRVIVKNKEKALLLRRANGRETVAGKFEFPGGNIEFGEQPTDALKRCFNRYLGMEVETPRLSKVMCFTTNDEIRTQHICILYEGSVISNVIVPQSRYDKYVWRKLSDMEQEGITPQTQSIITRLSDTSGVVISKKQKTSGLSTNDANIIYSDGGSRGNPGPSASAYVIFGPNQQVIAEGGVYLGITTNNQAEYQAVYQALKKAIEMGIKKIEFRLDSNLVVNQLNGIYKIRNRDLWPIHQNIKQQIGEFDSISFVHVRREDNQIADGLVNNILDEHTTG